MKLCLGCMSQYDEEYDVCPYCGYVEGTGAEEAYHMQPGSLLQDRYVIGRVLGYGGFGVTYVAWDEQMERKVAVKEYLPSEFSTRMPDSTQVTVFSGDKEEQFQSGLDKFIDEAKRLAKFHSANGIIHIFDSFKENNTAYIVMEYLEGETLKERLQREGKMEINEALAIVLPILYALKEVHKLGIIHRDIAPDNIYLTNETDANGNPIVKLLDFGAARFSTTKHSKSLSVLVKPGYSPEEQYRSKGDQGPWTDVYAVSATLYRMITGVVPQDSIERCTKDNVKKPSQLGIKINKSLENAIRNGMNIKIENRTQSVDSLIEELESEQTKRRKEKIRHMDIGRWPRWLKITAGSLTAAVVAMIVLVGLWMADVIKPVDSTIPKGQTRVPNVINLSVAKAEKQAKAAGLEFQIIDKEYSSDVGMGKVLKQNHLGGSLVALVNEDKSKGTLAVTISAGQEMTYVPDVQNFMLEAAQQQMTNANLVTTTREEAGDDAPGSVASQSVEPNTEVNVGTNVELVVSTGRDFDASINTTAPNVVGMDYTDAKKLCIDKCLYLAKSELRADDNIPKGQIMEQSVMEGESIPQNSTIMVVVSAGKETVYVPDVQYKLQDEAVALLQAQKLTVKIKEKDSDTVQKGRVISQSVESGTRVKAGTEVVIYISKGNSKADNSITANDIVITQEINKEAEKQQDKPNKNKNDNTQDTSVTVPNVVGKSSGDARTALLEAGLSPYDSYAFSNSVAEGRVISQSLASGTKVGLDESVLITISKGPEAPTGWTTDASFVDNPYYNVQTKVQYQTQTRSKTRDVKNIVVAESAGQPNTPSGYSFEERTDAGYTNWSAWRDNGTSGGTNSECVQYKVIKTEYKYIKYECPYGDKCCHSPYTWKCGNHGEWMNTYYEMWSNKVPSGGSYSAIDGQTGITYEFLLVNLGPNDDWWYCSNYPTTRNIYQVRTREKQYRYVFVCYVYGDWSPWSHWQDQVVSANDTTNVQTRTVYYYTAK